MRYFSAISSLIVLNILTVLFLLYLGNVSREIEKQNYTLEKKINFINDQIRTNEIEFSLYHNYDLGNVSREIEKQNYTLEKKINFINDQIRINEIEFSLYHNYGYLKKLHKVYFDGEQFESFSNKRLSFVDIQKKNFKNIYTVGTQ